MTELALITKPCDLCGVPVEDEDVPDFKDQWLCYWCHCQKDGKNLKEVFNSLSQFVKHMNRLAARHNPRPVDPERAAEARAKLKAHPNPQLALENIMEALKPEADEECVERAGQAWDAWEAERDEFQKVVLQMELGLHVAGLMEHIEALGEWGYDNSFTAAMYVLDKADQYELESGTHVESSTRQVLQELAVELAQNAHVEAREAGDLGLDLENRVTQFIAPAALLVHTRKTKET